MKTKKLAHATTASLLLLSLTLGACGKNTITHEVMMMPSTTNAQTEAVKLSAEDDHEAWTKLVLSNEKNIALAEILSASVAKENQALVNELVSSLSKDEVEAIISQVQEERKALKKSFLFRQNTQLEGTDLFKNSILNEGYNVEDSEIQLMTVATFSYLKSKSLNEIFESLNATIDQNSKDVAHAMIQDITLHSPMLAAEIEKTAAQSTSVEDFVNKLRESKPYLDKADEFFQSSGLNTREQLMVVATGAVGAVIYTELKDTKTFAKIMQKYKELKVVIEDVKDKIALIKMSVEVIKTNTDSMKAASEDMNDGLLGMKEGIQETMANVRNSPNADSKKVAQALYDKIIKGKNIDKGEANASILTSQKKISEGMQKSFAAAETMAGNLYAICGTVNLLTTTLGIKLPSGVQKAINTASKVAEGVKLAANIVSSFATGGVMSAIGAFTSGPIGGLLGMGGGTDPQVMAALGRIEAKLDQVLETQQTIINNQIETMKMIRNLAIMVDEYHQKEMTALAALHDDNMINAELGKAKLNSNIRRCEALIDFQLKKFWGNDARNSFSGSITTEIDYNKFYSNFKDLGDFRKFARGVAKDDYNFCQNALSEAFGSTSTIGNPILAIFNSEDGSNLFTFQRDTYAPLVKMLSEETKDSGQQSKLLHFPMSKISDLDLKTKELVMEKSSLRTNSTFNYNLENLISTKSLERYFSSYAILYPIFEFDKEDWDMTLSQIVDAYYKDVKRTDGTTIEQGGTNNVSRSYFLMNNALDFVQSAIAQEAILAGESLIPTINKKLGSSLLKNDECASESYVCAIRSNKLLMQNYINYVIKKNINLVNTEEIYKTQIASATPNLSLLSGFLGLKDNSDGVLVMSNGHVALSLKAGSGSMAPSTVVLLPQLDKVLEGRMVYSENMPRLLKMQQDAISALVKISPSQFSSVDNRVGLANLLLVKQF